MVRLNSLPEAQQRNTVNPEETSSWDSFSRLSSATLAITILATPGSLLPHSFGLETQYITIYRSISHLLTWVR